MTRRIINTDADVAEGAVWLAARDPALARALDVALAGPRSYDGVQRDLAWVNGSGRKDIGAPDIDAAVTILWRVWGVLLLTCLTIATLHTL